MWLTGLKAPIDDAFPVRSMQQVYSKLHAEAAPLKNARIWRVWISPRAVLLPLVEVEYEQSRWEVVWCGSDGVDEDAVRALTA